MENLILLGFEHYNILKFNLRPIQEEGYHTVPEIEVAIKC